MTEHQDVVSIELDNDETVELEANYVVGWEIEILVVYTEDGEEFDGSKTEEARLMSALEKCCEERKEAHACRDI